MPDEVHTSGADIIDFKTINESVGQLFGYFYSENSVALGTLSASSAMNTDMYRIQMAIGLSNIADGEYVCEAKTFYNGTRRIIVKIRAVRRECLSIINHFVRYLANHLCSLSLCT